MIKKLRALLEASDLLRELDVPDCLVNKVVSLATGRLLHPIEWKSRDEPTPDGQRIWASDGEGQVWEIWGRGKPIGESATRVKFWAAKTVPDPPGRCDSPTWEGDSGERV